MQHSQDLAMHACIVFHHQRVHGGCSCPCFCFSSLCGTGRAVFPASLGAGCGCATAYLPVECASRWFEEPRPCLLNSSPRLSDSPPFPQRGWRRPEQPASQLLMAEPLPAWVSEDRLEQSCPPSWNAHLGLLPGRHSLFFRPLDFEAFFLAAV